MYKSRTFKDKYSCYYGVYREILYIKARADVFLKMHTKKFQVSEVLQGSLNIHDVAALLLFYS